MVDYTKARLHNLLIRIYKEATKKKPRFKYDDVISKQNLVDLYFRKADFRMIDEPNTLMDKVEGGYRLTDSAKRKVKSYLEEHKKYKGEAKQPERYIQLFITMESLRRDDSMDKGDKVREIKNKLLLMAPALHWNNQPEYEEYLLINSGQLPEDDLNKFYDHYHMLEDLYWVLSKDSQRKKIDTTLGDINLGENITFDVHSNRWGHLDRYHIKRTMDGWCVDRHSGRIEGDKYGSAIILFLDHDRIIYPHKIKDFFARIWDYADGYDAKIEEIQELMQGVADWISVTEKTGSPIERKLRELLR